MSKAYRGVLKARIKKLYGGGVTFIKFKKLSCEALADWLIKSRKGNKKKIVGSLNQQIVFNRKRNPSYAKKMKCARNKAMKKLGDGKK